MKRNPSACIRLFAACLLGLSAISCCQAQTNFHVSLNTASLIGSPNGLFSLDFQLTDGSGTGDANNTATVYNFDYGGGRAAGAPMLTGGSTGSIITSLTLIDSQFFNELYQTFLPGATLDFNVTLTANDDAGGTPDQFVFGILDNTLANLPTTDAGGALLTADITSTGATIGTFTALAPYDALGTPVVTFPQAPPPQNTPEPGAWAFLLTAAVPGGLLLARRRKRH